MQKVETTLISQIAASKNPDFAFDVSAKESLIEFAD